MDISGKVAPAISLFQQAKDWGHEDALRGADQQGGVYFIVGGAAWRHYNEGYAEGCEFLRQAIGEQRPYWLPTSQEI